MKKLKWIIPAFLLSCLLLAGCADDMAYHQEIDYSPEGDYVAYISNLDEDTAPKESAIMTKRAYSESEEPFKAYVAGEGIKIYSVFWKKNNIVFFESGERWMCDKTGGSAPESARYPIRISSFPNSLVESKTPATDMKTLFEAEYDCQAAETDESSGEMTRYLQRTNISNARNADVIVYENFDKSPESSGGLNVLNTETGQINRLLDGRQVKYPSVSADGEKVAFFESIDPPHGNEEEEKKQERLEVLDMDDMSESEVISLGSFYRGRPVWSEDGRYFFFAGVSSIPYTLSCEKDYIKSEYSKVEKVESADIENDEEKDNNALTNWLASADANRVIAFGKNASVIDGNIYMLEKEEKSIYVANYGKGVEKGKCDFRRENIPEEKRDNARRVYISGIYHAYTVHKYYADYGIAVRILDSVDSFSINPETKEILANMYNPEKNVSGSYLFDYSGKLLREADYEYIDKFMAVNKDGDSADMLSSGNRNAPALLDNATQKESLIISRKQDLLAVARFHFDQGEYEKAREFYLEYKNKYGLPDSPGDRILMIATYRHVKDYEAMIAMTKEVPVEMLQMYFKTTDQK